MDGKPVQVIDIEKDEKTQKSTYNLKFDALYEIICEINDMEVAVISIAGPSRQGKSFLLSYLLRYLSNPADTNWIGDNTAPLTGFKWNHGIEPETKGVWIWSKPIILRQSVGKEIAILIMDTQGVYDEYTDLRDWSTIVGITLLTSSCFIFNVFTDIQEDILSKLETFVNYGLLATTKDEANRHAFQRLLFLIRDWNHARDYNYGHTGGKQYITQKLSIKSNQTQSSQRTRKLIGKCFEDVTCYLMPEPGDERDKDGFNGSVSQLTPKFVSKLKELFSVLLNPDSLKPKLINGTTITGRALLKFFEVFIEKFNGDDLPQPMDLVEAVAKATDLNLIYNLKESYVSQMNKELQSKLFVSKYELEVLHNEIFTEIHELFKTSKKSQNYDIVKQLTQMFNKEMRTVYTKIHLENEERRERTAKDTIEKSINIYCESMYQFMDENKFLKAIDFDNHSIESKKLAKKYITDILGDEEIDSNAPYFLKIYKSIEENENSFKSENNRRKTETKRNNSQAIDDCVTYYCEHLSSLLNDNVFLANQLFNQCEQDIRAESIQIFVNKRIGDEESLKKFQELLKSRLNNEKSEFYALNRKTMKETMIKTESDLTSALSFCEEKLTETLGQFSGNEDLNQIYEYIKQNTIEMFENKCNVKDSNFLSPYKTKLEAEIDNTFADFIKQFKFKVEELDRFYITTVEDVMNICFVQIKTLFDGKSLKSAEELATFREDLISDVMKKYEKASKHEILNEIKDYVYERTATAADLLIIDKLIEYYGQKMTETLIRKTFFSREEISQIHSENSEHVIQTFNTHKKSVSPQLFNELFTKLKDKLMSTYDEYYSLNEQNRESNVEEAIESSFGLYKAFMSQELDNVCIESKQFDELSAGAKKKAFKQLDLFCGEEKELIEFYNKKLTKLIDSAENEFKSQNDNNFSEAKRKNSESVNQSLNHYSERMSFALNESLFYSKDSFKQYENSIRDESYKLFTENCKYGGNEFITGFAIDLENKIKPLKSQFKATFSNNMEKLESEVRVKINDALNQYNEFMYVLMDALKSVQQFRSKHNEVKAKAINSFMQKCLLKDNQYRDQQISILENAINDSCDELHNRLSDQLKKSGKSYEKSVKKSFVSYKKLMEELLSNNISISEEELENLNQNIVKDVLSEFENNFQDEEDLAVIESNRRALELKIMNEFDSIKNTNRMRNESNERSEMKLKLEIRNYVNEYEDRMDKMMPFCGDETELLAQHLEIENIVKEKMIESNPFPNLMALEPFLTTLEVEINKSFNDFNKIFKVTLDKQLLSHQNVIMNARKYYREEMQKHYTNANFLKPDKLIALNNSVMDYTINKYQSERGNMSPEKFSNLVKESLIDIFTDIMDENDKNTPTLPAIGIDLGTTNSCVAYYQTSRPKGRVNIVPNELGNRTTPSVVAFGDNDEEVIGESAIEQSYRNSRNFIYSAKRLIGRQFDEDIVQNDMNLWPFRVVDDGNNIAKISVKVDGNDKVFFPEEISAKILKKLKQTAENHLGCKVRNAVITVPAYFNDAQKEATKDAGKIAGLNVLKIINEPTAAAIAFQLNRSDDLGSRKVLIYDFGGGTLDVAVLVIERGVIDIKAVGGDNHLGGDDIDANLVQYCLNDFIAETQITFNKSSEDGETALRRLTNECEKRKRQLCSVNSAVVKVDHFYDGTDLRCELTREKFEELNNDLFVKSTDLVSQVLVDSSLEPSDIDDVVLVGGTTRIPKIQELLSDLFYGKALNHSINPDEAVAVGAAIQAAILNGTHAQSEELLRVSDVTPMSLGVKVKDGFMSVIVHRNSKVPNKYTKQYETTSDNQTEVDIEIYEGEETMAADNRKLGTFTLSNIPAGPAGEQQIEVNFEINDEGILHVNAKIISSGEEEEILITEHKGRLTDEELQFLIEQGNQ